MHHITQDCTTLHYNTVRYTILHCITLYYTILLYYPILYYTKMSCTTMRCNIMHCIVTHYTTMHYNTLLCMTNAYCSSTELTVNFFAKERTITLLRVSPKVVSQSTEKRFEKTGSSRSSKTDLRR